MVNRLPSDHTIFATSPCGMCTVTHAADNWHVWIYDYLWPKPFTNEVKAVMFLQSLTLKRR